MKFLNPQVEEEWRDVKINIRLRRLMAAVEAYCMHNLGIEIVITDVLRNDPNSPHSDGRACDLRSIGMFSETHREQLRNWTNLSFPYGSDVYSSCKYERKGQINPNGSVATGDHFHFQVRPL